MRRNYITRVRIGIALYNACIRDGYSFNRFMRDILAGITVGIIAIPLAMALAIASGVPPQYGLYTAGIAGMIAALAGGSKLSVSGPTAAFVVILFPVAQQYGLQGLLVATLFSGIILLIMGLARLGRVIEYIPLSVTLGFTAGIAITIASMQFVDFFGLTPTVESDDFITRITMVGSSLPTLQWGDTLVGITTLGILIFWPKLKINFPGHLPAIIAGVLVMLAYQWFGYDIQTIGSKFSYLLPNGEEGQGIPPVLPSFVLPWNVPAETGSFEWTWKNISALLPAAFSMAVLGAIESLLCAVILDNMTRTKHNPNSELLGQGLSNVVAPFFGGITSTAAIARSAVNFKAGATSPVSAIVHSLFVLAALLFFARYLSYLPLAAMAALLFMVAWNMSEARKIKDIMQKAPKGDIAVLLVCLFLTVFFDMIIAISIGVVLAALLFMKNIADLTKLTEIDCEQFDENEILYTIQGPLFFAAAERIFSELSELSDHYQTIILDWDHVTLLDVGGLQAFTRFMEDLNEGKRVMICNIPFQPLKTLARAKIQPLEGRLDFYSSRAEIFEELDHESNACIEVTKP